MNIFLGPGGLPISSKGSSTVEGLKKVAEIGLNAMEIEFVRSIYLNDKTAAETREAAKEFGVRLSVHAPYFINLCSKEEKTIAASKNRILKSLEISEILNADAIAVHAAYYSGLTPDRAYEKLKENILEILDEMKSRGIKNAKFGLETMGRSSQFGSLEEIIKMCKEVKNKQLVPYLDWGHLYVRGKGRIDYKEILNKLDVLKLDHINSQFTGVDKNKKGEFVDVHTPMSEYPPFEPLAEELIKKKTSITIISETPLLEIDSLKMKETFEKLKHPI